MRMRTYVFVDGENLRRVIKGAFGDSFDLYADYLPKAADWDGFFRRIAEKAKERAPEIDAVLLKTYWYVVADVDARPTLPSIKNDGEMMAWKERHKARIDSHLAHVNRGKKGGEKLSASTRESIVAVVESLRDAKARIERRFRGHRVIQSAIEHKNRSLQFRRSGYIGFDLLAGKGGKMGREKTTDVNLALDMLLLKDAYDMAIIVSGDQDFLPAVRAAQRAGKIVLNVAFRAAVDPGASAPPRLLPGGAKRLNEAVDWSIEFANDELRELMRL